MIPDGSLTLFHVPGSRSTAAVILLEELGVPYRLHLLDARGDAHAWAAYRAVEPLGRVPALLHHGQLVSEPAAVALYLADLYPDRALAPSPTEPLRGPYLRWMIWLAGLFEPSRRGGGADGPDPWDGLMSALDEALRRGPCLLGERFSAVDVMWAGALNDPAAAPLLEGHERLRAYRARVLDRPAARRVLVRDGAWSAEAATGRTVEIA